MKNLILQKFALIGFTLIISSCGNQKELDSKVMKMDSAINNLNVFVSNMTASTTGYLSTTTAKDNSYWDIQLATSFKSIYFGYHRKNASEMWQPINGIYSGEGYARVPYRVDILNDEYIIIAYKY